MFLGTSFWAMFLVFAPLRPRCKLVSQSKEWSLHIVLSCFSYWGGGNITLYSLSWTVKSEKWLLFIHSYCTIVISLWSFLSVSMATFAHCNLSLCDGFVSKSFGFLHFPTSFLLFCMTAEETDIQIRIKPWLISWFVNWLWFEPQFSLYVDVMRNYSLLKPWRKL